MIALTAYAGETGQKRLLAAAFQKHIAKPVEPEKLLAAIADLIWQKCDVSLVDTPTPRRSGIIQRFHALYIPHGFPGTPYSPRSIECYYLMCLVNSSTGRLLSPCKRANDLSRVNGYNYCDCSRLTVIQ